MRYNQLGRTGVEVSLICLGTMTWGEQNSEADGHAQMDYALDQGVNFFDTAELYAVPPRADTYGRTEEIIGTWFAKTGNRDNVVLASKVVGPGLPWIRDGKPYTKHSLSLAVEESLRRLQTDYIDLYQLHWPNRGSYHFGQHWAYSPDFDLDKVEADMISILESLSELVAQGKIRHVGLSNETSWGTMKWLNLAEKYGLPRMASIQNEYSLLCRLFDTDLHEVAVTEDCGLLAWSPLATGLLSGKYANGARPAGSRWSIEERTVARDTENAHKAVADYIKVAERHGLDVCQMALAFVNSRPFLTANIIGATSMGQLKTAISSVGVTLSDECMKDIAAVTRDYPVPY